jgi:hypothetical protein
MQPGDTAGLLPPLFLPRDLEVEGRSAAAEIKTLMRRTAEDILRVGHLLIEMSASKLGHGNFLPWLGAEFEMSQSTAYNFIAVAEKLAATNRWKFAPQGSLRTCLRRTRHPR